MLLIIQKINKKKKRHGDICTHLWEWSPAARRSGLSLASTLLDNNLLPQLAELHSSSTSALRTLNWALCTRPSLTGLSSILLLMFFTAFLFFFWPWLSRKVEKKKYLGQVREGNLHNCTVQEADLGA